MARGSRQRDADDCGLNATGLSWAGRLLDLDNNDAYGAHGMLRPMAELPRSEPIERNLAVRNYLGFKVTAIRRENPDLEVLARVLIVLALEEAGVYIPGVTRKPPKEKD